MADLKYVFEVDDKDILTTIKNHEILEKRVTSLKKEYAKLDLATNSGKANILDYAKATQQLDQKIAHLEATLKKGGSAVNQMATGMNISGKSGRNMELQFQQAGYQIQDFIVQVQGGVNPLIAFSQQGSQLAGFFAGPWGAAIGLGIAALSSFAMVMLSSSEDADKAKVSIMSLSEAQKELNKSTVSYANQVDMINFGVDTEQEVIALKESIRLKSQLNKLNEEYRNTDSLGRRQRISEEATILKTQLYQNEVELNKLALSRAELDTLNFRIEAHRREAEEYAAIVKEANDLKDSIGQAYLESLNLAQVPLEKGINGAAEAARLLAERLGISLDKATGLVQLSAQQNLAAMKFEFSSGGQALKKYGSRAPNVGANMPVIGVDGKPLKPISSEPSGGVAGMGGQTQEEYIAKLTREYEMKKKSLGLTDEQVKRTEFLFSLDERLSTMKTKRSEVEIQTEKLRAIAAYDAYAAAEKQSATMDMISSNLNDAFMSMVDGSQTVAGAFNNMMRNILKSVYEQSVTQPLANGITGLLKGFLGGGGGGTGSMGLPMPFAKGGVVGSATTFQTSGGRMGLMGEAGPEAIMPLKRGANGQLGVQVNGNNSGNGGSITVNNNINVVGSDAAMVRAEVTKMIPQITEASKSAIIDAKRRGGQMGAAFQ